MEERLVCVVCCWQLECFVLIYFFLFLFRFWCVFFRKTAECGGIFVGATIARGSRSLPTTAQPELPILPLKKNSRDNELVVVVVVVFQEEAQLQQIKHIGDNCDQSLV